MKYRDITNQIYSRLTAIKPVYTDKHNQMMWLFQCSCGKQAILQGRRVIIGNTKSCGCMRKEMAAKRGTAKRIDLTGIRVGKLTVVKMLNATNESGNMLCEVLCNCGIKKILASTEIIRKRSKSCGCLRGITGNWSQYLKHRQSETRFYRSWKNMKKRCYGVNSPAYKDYGGRGIIVCENWLNFEGYKKDMLDFYEAHLKQFGEKNTTLDRIDPNGNYTLENTRWATIKEQSLNKRNSKPIPTQA